MILVLALEDVGAADGTIDSAVDLAVGDGTLNLRIPSVVLVDVTVKLRTSPELVFAIWTERDRGIQATQDL